MCIRDRFKGVYDRKEKNVSLFKAAMNGQKEVDTEIVDASDEAVFRLSDGKLYKDGTKKWSTSMINLLK